MKKLNWEGVETLTTDTYYDIINGYYDEEIKDKYSLKKLKEAVDIIESLAIYLEDNELIG